MLRLLLAFIVAILTATSASAQSAPSPFGGFFPDLNAGAADNNATYFVLNSSTILSNERLLRFNASRFSTTDGGSGGNYDVDISNLDIAHGGTGGTTQTTANDNLRAYASLATGDLDYYNGTHWVRRGIGSSGDVLTVTGGVPVWAPPSLSLGSDLHFVTTQAEASLSNESVLTGTANRITVASGATLDIGSDVVTLTGSQTVTNKTATGLQMSYNSGSHFVLKGTTNNATVKGADWGQTTDLNIPDPGAASADFVLTKANQTIAGTKTFSAAPVLSTNTLSGNGNTMTFPSSAQTLVGLTSTDTLTNKTLTSPHIGTSFILDQVGGNYTFTFTNPAANRAYRFTDVNGGADVAMKDANAYTQGGVAYGDGNVLKFNTAGTSGQPLVSGGTGAPTFASALGQTVGGTGAISWAAGDLLTVNDAGTVVRLPQGSNTQILTMDTTGDPNIKWAAAPATGYATIQEEGSGLTQRSILNFVGSAFTAADNTTKTDVTMDSDINTISQLSATAGNIMAGNDSNAWTTLAGGSNGDLLTYDSTGNPNVKWAALDSDLTTIAALTCNAGDIIIGNDSNAWTDLAQGSNGQVLTMDTTGNPNAKWAAPAMGTFTVTTNSSGFTASYNTIHVINSSGGAVTATLPTAASHTGEWVMLVLGTVGNNVTVNTTSSQTYDGQASGSIVSGVRYNKYWFISDGSNWMIL